VADVRGTIHDLEGGLFMISKESRCLVFSKDEGIKTLAVLGDSMLIIRVVKDQTNPRWIKMSSLTWAIKRATIYFDKIYLYHFKRELNDAVDYWAKVASSLSPSSII
jgi:hypothetical protein